jgi:hypothetical protein
MKSSDHETKPRARITVLLLIGYLDVMILGGAALIAHFIDNRPAGNFAAVCTATASPWRTSRPEWMGPDGIGPDAMRAGRDCENGRGGEAAFDSPSQAVALRQWHAGAAMPAPRTPTSSD